MRSRFVIAFLAALGAVPAYAEQARPVPDTPASFTLTGDQHWVVLSVWQDGEAAIGLAREQATEDPGVQVARTRDGKYAVIAGPTGPMSAGQLKEKFADIRGAKDVRQSRGEELVARAWQSTGSLARAGMQEGKPVKLEAGSLSVSLRVQPSGVKKNESYVLVTEGREDGKVVFTARSEPLPAVEVLARASIVRLEGTRPQASITYYTGGAHCCAKTVIAMNVGGKWQLIPAGSRDGHAGPDFEDLDGDGTVEMLSGDNRFLYAFSSYATSVMPAKIEKLLGGKIVDVTRRPEYRRYHVQYLAALEARAGEEDWKESGFLAGWVAQKALPGQRAEAIAKARKSFEKGDTPDFEVCMIDRPIDKCAEIDRKLVPLAEALGKFLDKHGYR